MAGIVVADTLQADSTSTLVLKNGVANTPPTVQDSAGTQIGTFCRAFVNFNGTGTVAIRASFNVSSITDNGTGDYTVNFTTALADANYSFQGTASQATGATNGQIVSILASSPPTTSAIRFRTQQDNVGVTDSEFICLAIFR